MTSPLEWLTGGSNTLDTADQLIRQVHQDRPGWRRIGFRVVRGRQAQDRPPMVFAKLKNLYHFATADEESMTILMPS